MPLWSMRTLASMLRINFSNHENSSASSYSAIANIIDLRKSDIPWQYDMVGLYVSPLRGAALEDAQTCCA